MALGAHELSEPEARQERELVRLLRQAVGDEAIGVAEPQPVRGVAEEPRTDAAAAVGLVDPERVELAPARQA